MTSILRGLAWIDALNEWVGRSMSWALLAMVGIAAANALSRKLFNFSSNAFLEVQWYLFSAIFLLSAAYVLRHNGHVRIDILSQRLSHRSLAWLDLIGALLCLLPFAMLMVWFSWPEALESWRIGEMSSDANGLPRGIVRSLIPIGFSLLALQGVAEILRRIAFLSGHLDAESVYPSHREGMP